MSEDSKRLAEIRERARLTSEGGWHDDVTLLLSRIEALEAKCALYAASLKQADAREEALDLFNVLRRHGHYGSPVYRELAERHDRALLAKVKPEIRCKWCEDKGRVKQRLSRHEPMIDGPCPACSPEQTEEPKVCGVILEDTIDSARWCRNIWPCPEHPTRLLGVMKLDE
jgi:hypothetical protein